MATRGIYQFTNDNGKSLRVYNHYDNYPQGAASFFYKTLCEWHKSQGSFLERFIRSMPTAEIEQGVEFGWIEYEYHVSGLQNNADLIAYKVNSSVEDKYEIFSGRLIDFISENSDGVSNIISQPFNPFKVTELGTFNLDQVQTIIRNDYGALKMLNSQHIKRNNPNFKNAMSELEIYFKHFPELMEDEDVKEALATANAK